MKAGIYLAIIFIIGKKERRMTILNTKESTSNATCEPILGFKKKVTTSTIQRWNPKITIIPAFIVYIPPLTCLHKLLASNNLDIRNTAEIPRKALTNIKAILLP